MLALVAAVGYGVSDFVGGVASRRVAALRVVIVSYPISLVIVAVIAPFVGGTPAVAPMLWGAASGVAGGLAVWWFYLALASGPMAIVSPVTAVLVAGVPVGVGLALGERPSIISLCGIALALIAVVLVSKESPDEPVAGGDGAPRRPHARFTPVVAWLTVGSGLAFGVAFIALDRIGDSDTGLWPLVMSRLTATIVVWGVALSIGQRQMPPRSIMPMVLSVAVLDIIANTAILYAFQGGLLSLVSVIASLYPAATVLLAMVVLGERVGRLQQVGMAVAFVAVGLIAATG